MNIPLEDYPIKYITPAVLNDGTIVQLRPVHPLDGENPDEIKKSFSDRALYDRFLGYIPKVSERLTERLTHIDYHKEMAILAELVDNEERQVIGIGRIAREEATEAEIAVIISDTWQGKGLGTMLTDYMIEIAKKLEYQKITALVFNHNKHMLEILSARGFSLSKEDASTTRADLPIDLNKE